MRCGVSSRGVLIEFIAVCLGGAAGSGARYLVGVVSLRWFGVGFPYGTLIVNILGSFLIALLFEWFAASKVSSPGLRVGLTTGLMGGLTTYSTFNQNLLHLFRSGSWGVGTWYFILTVVLSLAAGLLGLAAGRWPSPSGA